MTNENVNVIEPEVLADDVVIPNEDNMVNITYDVVHHQYLDALSDALHHHAEHPSLRWRVHKARAERTARRNAAVRNFFKNIADTASATATLAAHAVVK